MTPLITPDRGREMGKTTRINAKKKILRQRRKPADETYYKCLLDEP